MPRNRLFIVALMAIAMPASALTQATLNSVRIGAADTVALAKFYETAFGMQEVNRIDVPG